MLHLKHGSDYASSLFDSKERLSFGDTDISVYQMVVDNNREHLDETALMFLGKKVTYRALIGQADFVADLLASSGLKRGDMILSCINGTPQSVSLLLACSKMGVCAMMLTPRTTEAMFTHVVNDYNGKYLFCTTMFYPVFSSLSAIDRLTNVIIMPVDKTIGEDNEVKTHLSDVSNIITWAEYLERPVTARAETVRGGSEPLAICSTTGSTGIPKGIVLKNSSYVALEKICTKTGWNWKRGDILFSIVPTFVATGISLVLFIPLMMGVTILQEPRLNPFETFIFNLVTYRPSIVLATKSIWMSMAESLHDSYDLSGVRFAFTVGETISKVENETVNKFLSGNGAKVSLENMYGMSECNSILTYHSADQRIATSAGIPVPYASVAVFDLQTEEECKFGELGAVYFRTPTVMSGYFMNKEATDEFFVKDDNGGIWGRTADIGYIMDNGEIVICCRTKEHFVDENGVGIFPFMIEDVIKRDENVKRCKVLATEYHGKKVLAAHLTLFHKVEDTGAYVRKLQEMCRADKSLKILPSLYKIRETLPISQAGKIDMIAMAAETEGFTEA